MERSTSLVGSWVDGPNTTPTAIRLRGSAGLPSLMTRPAGLRRWGSQSATYAYDSDNLRVYSLTGSTDTINFLWGRREEVVAVQLFDL